MSKVKTYKLTSTELGELLWNYKEYHFLATERIKKCKELTPSKIPEALLTPEQYAIEWADELNNN